MVWKPHVTVAAVVEQNGSLLMVEEQTEEGIRINQPAGHWEPHESLAEGVVRETLEETGRHFSPTHLLGVYNWTHPARDITYLRFAFVGTVSEPITGHALDEGILRALWMRPEEIAHDAARHRSPLVLRCVQDYLAGKRWPLDLLTHHA
ncbi:MAG: NUDIX hydrolase [Burkholderiales bacterium]